MPVQSIAVGALHCVAMLRPSPGTATNGWRRLLLSLPLPLGVELPEHSGDPLPANRVGRDDLDLLGQVLRVGLQPADHVITGHLAPIGAREVGQVVVEVEDVPPPLAQSGDACGVRAHNPSYLERAYVVDE